jgi:DNA-binding beta-propeller fold protein YncE
MTEVFIAYAREDEPFARRLHDTLSSSGREPVWDQDHAAVPFGVPWRQEIREAIQGSDKFIFVISPESLASEACAGELAQAVEFSKQVIPILRRMPGEGQAVPKAIEELNWILFGEDAEFGRSFRQLSAVLDIDVAWTKTHTRLLGRAVQWASSRDRSLLLRGSELRMAEAWLGEAAEHEKTPPTRIQRDYISRSRQAADRAARRWRGALAAGLAVAIALAATALVQRGQAIGQRNQAIREARVTLSGKLAANSGALDATDPTTASLLAAAAWRIFPTEQARESMLGALAQPERRILPVSTDGVVGSMAFRPDGKMLATGTSSGQVRLWSTARHAIGAPLRGGTGIGINDAATALAFSPDGKLLATASGQGLVRVWDVATRHQIGTPMAATSSRGGLLASVAFSPDGKLLATGIDFRASRILLWDVTTHKQIGTPLPGGASLAFSPDGKILAGAGNDGSAVLWDVATHRQVGASLAATTAGPANPVVSVAFSPNGRTLAAANANGTVRLWKLATHRQLGASMSAGAGVEGPAALAFSLDGKTLATADLTGHVRLWDTATHQQTGQPIATSTDCDSAISAITFSPVTDFLATAGCDGT